MDPSSLFPVTAETVEEAYAAVFAPWVREQARENGVWLWTVQPWGERCSTGAG